MREFRRAAEKRRKKALTGSLVSVCSASTSSWAYAWLDETASLDQIPQLPPARITYVARSKKIAAFTATISIAALVRFLYGL